MSARPLFFEDVEVGTEISPPVRERITTQHLVQWAGVAEDYTPIHYDKDWALSQGLPGVIIHGPFKCALLGRLLTEWMGEKGVLRRLACSHRAMNLPGETLVCRGRVSRTYVKDRQGYVECEVWVENQDGIMSAMGSATVTLPLKSSQERV